MYFENKIIFFIFHTGPSWEIIEDDVNMISFFKEPDEMVFGMADDSEVSLSDAEYEDRRMILDDDDDDDDDLNGP